MLTGREKTPKMRTENAPNEPNTRTTANTRTVANTRTRTITANAPNEVNAATPLTYAKRNLKSEKVTEKLITYVMRRTKA